jgi:hypothetical protein
MLHYSLTNNMFLTLVLLRYIVVEFQNKRNFSLMVHNSLHLKRE